MRWLPLPAVLLVLALLGGAQPAPAAAQGSAGMQCLFDQATAPTPTDGTVVLAAKTIDPNAQNPNGLDVLILPADGQLRSDFCGGRLAFAVLGHPSIIAVGKGAAIQFWDFVHALQSDWGAVSTDAGGPVLFPGRPDFTPAFVRVSSASEFLGATGSCRGCVLSGSTINASFPGPGQMPAAYQFDLSDAQLDHTTWEVLDPSGTFPTGDPVPLAGFNLTNANLSGAQGLQGANLSQANLSRAVLDPLDLSRANLTGAVLHTRLEHVIGLGTAALTRTDLSGASLTGVDLADAKFDHPIVSGTSFDGADLRGSQLIGLQFQIPPSFSGVTVGESNGTCTAFQDSDIHDVSLTLAKATAGCASSPLLPNTTASLGLVASLYTGPGLAEGLAANVDLADARFLANAGDRSVLAGLDLHGINLQGSAFVGWPVDLSGTKLDGASLQGASFQLAELAGATFHDAQAAGAVFRGARLAASGGQPAANFAGSRTNLQGADFIEADVSGASFASADLSAGASGKPTAFDRALAAGTDFTGVTAKQTSFVGAHIYGNGGAFDQATDLGGADFTDALLAGDVKQGGGFDLTGAPLSGAKFDGAQCIGCNFTGAHLDRASFVGAYLPGAVLSNASLGGTNLDNAWLYCGDLQNSACASVGGDTSAGPRPPTGSATPDTTSTGTRSAGGVCGRLLLAAGDLIQAAGNAEIDLVDGSCQRRPVPDSATQAQIEQTSHAAPRPLASEDWQQVPIGPTLPSADADPSGFAQAMRDIFGSSDTRRAGVAPRPSPGLLPSPSPTTSGAASESPTSAPSGTWSWPLALGFGEVYGPVPFANTDLTGVSLVDLAYCPDGDPPDASAGCAGDAILPTGGMTGPPIPCSTPVGQPDGRGAVALAACPTTTSTVYVTSGSKPLAVAAASPPSWATSLTGRGFYVGLDDGTVRLVGDGDSQIVAGQSGQHCASPTSPCGDGGSATDAQLGAPVGLAVGPDGSLYVADAMLHRVRRIDPSSHTISTLAGSGQLCSQPDAPCGDGGPAPAATLGGPNGVWADLSGNLWIADGQRGLRQVFPNGTIDSVGVTPGAYTVQSVVGDDSGHLYAATTDPDYLLEVTPPPPPAPPGQTCQQLGLGAGSLIETAGAPEIDIVDPSCQRRHVPDLTTLSLIEQSYDLPSTPVTLAEADWQSIPTGPAIPAAANDPLAFTEAMWQVFQPVCARLVLAPGELVQGAGGQEIDIVDRRCQRRHVPDGATLQQIEQTYHVGLTQLPATDVQDMAAGAAIPSASTDIAGFAQSMWDIFQPVCSQLTIVPGTLIQTNGNPEIDILNPSCQRQHVPDAATLQQIEQTFNVSVTQLSGPDWQGIATGPAIPSVSTDLTGFAQAMEPIFGSPCAALKLGSGTVIGSAGVPEIDVVEDSVGATCQRRHVPNPDTLQQIQQTYHPASSQLAGLDWQRIPAGPAVPDYDTDPIGYQLTVQQIFGGSCQTGCGASRANPTAAAEPGAALSVGGQARPVVGTGTSGYNGTIDGLCNLLPGTQVQIDHPTGLAVRADGRVLFADTGNNVVRAYQPAYETVVDLGGQIDTDPNDCPVQGTPPAGFNQDGQWADQTELNAPQGVTATSAADSLFVVADTGNGRVRLLGPSPLEQSAVSAAPATGTPTPTPTASSSATAVGSVTPEATPSATDVDTPTPTASGTAIASDTPTPSAAATATSAPTLGPSATPTPNPIATPTASATVLPRTPTPPPPTATATRPATTPTSERPPPSPTRPH